MSPFAAFLFLLGLETLHVRMSRHMENTVKVAKYLDKHPKVKSVIHPCLKRYGFLAMKIIKNTKY